MVNCKRFYFSWWSQTNALTLLYLADKSIFYLQQKQKYNFILETSCCRGGGARALATPITATRMGVRAYKDFFCWLGHLKMSFYYPTSHMRQGGSILLIKTLCPLLDSFSLFLMLLPCPLFRLFFFLFQQFRRIQTIESSGIWTQCVQVECKHADLATRPPPWP